MRIARPLSLTLVVVAFVACATGGSGSTPDGEFRAATAPANAGVATKSPAGPSAAASPSPTAANSVAASPEPSDDPGAAPRDDLPSRVVIASLDIDLPIVSGEFEVEGNPDDYPLCDVAQYLTTYRYPGRPGTTTWIYAHAREGMFLPLLEASTRGDGAELIGQEVEVSSTGAHRYRYRITSVHPHSTDRSVARDVPDDTGRLVLQTSEGPRGTVPKLQVVAELVDVVDTSPEEAIPSAEPRECYD